MKTLNETILNNISPLGDYLQNVPKPIKLLFLGEVSDPKHGNDYFKYIKQDIEDADLVICQYNYFNDDCDDFIKYLKSTGVKYALCANTHSYDNELDAVKHTVDVMYENELWHTGVYHDDIDRQTHTPSIIRVKNFRIGFISYTEKLTDNRFEDSNVNIFIGPDGTMRQKRLNEEIAKLQDQEVDMIICSLCFAEEYTFATSKRQKRIADWLFSQGVDMIIGQGSHQVQKIEFNPADENHDTAKLIAYSLGNCLSSHHMDEYSDADGGVILKVNINKNEKCIDSASYKMVWSGKSMYQDDDAYYTIPIRSQNVIDKTDDKFVKFMNNAHNLALCNNVNVNEEI